MVDKKVVETRYAHDSWGITICCGRLLRGGVDWKLHGFRRALKASWSPPSRRRGLKITSKVYSYIFTCRLLRGGVDWKLLREKIICLMASSPPSRRRGLKICLLKSLSPLCKSPPSRRRGLKILLHEHNFQVRMSPPSRRRGLKIGEIQLAQKVFHVASFAEAWIENFVAPLKADPYWVASFAEAWIENFSGGIRRRAVMSPPSRRRGLKILKKKYGNIRKVASFAEAWIEKSHKIRHKYRCWSPPSRRRGLKILSV